MRMIFENFQDYEDVPEILEEIENGGDYVEYYGPKEIKTRQSAFMASSFASEEETCLVNRDSRTLMVSCKDI